MGLHQTKNFLHSKGKHQQNKNTTHRIREHMTDIPDEGLISKLYKELTQHHQKKPNNQI